MVVTFALIAILVVVIIVLAISVYADLTGQKFR